MEISNILLGSLAYLIGAIPTGYLIAKFKGIADIREHGSGNIGATNVSRVLGKKYFFLIFSLDAGKAYLFIQLLKPYFDFNHLYFFAATLLFGNGCSIFLRGGGGKGVATLFGLLIALSSKQTAFLLFGIWAALLYLIGTVGIASVGAVVWLPFIAYRLHNPPFFLFSLFATMWIMQTHRSNIAAYWNKE